MAQNAAERNSSNLEEEIKRICLKLEDIHWKSDSGKTILDAANILTKKLDGIVRMIEEGEKPDIPYVIRLMDSLETSIRCLPGRRAPKAGEAAWELHAAIEDPVPLKGETPDECILREILEKGRIIGPLLRIETDGPSVYADKYAKAKAASEAAFSRPFKEDDAYIE